MMDEETLATLHFRNRFVDVPLDWDDPEGHETIRVFFREVTAVDKKDEDLPLLVYLQGGPGMQSPRPTADAPSWLHEAVKNYRVILPDQRGTGLSSPVTGKTMLRFAGDAEAGADYLACFDAHAIVADLEHIRKTVYDGKRWSTLGQSYGGFLTLTYLSYASNAIEQCFVTGGLPSIHADADAVYSRTYRTVSRKLEAHMARFPGDQARLDAIADCIEATRPTLISGDTLTVERFQLVGLILGMSDGSERLHWLIEQALAGPDESELTLSFLLNVETLTGFEGRELYAAIHENIYANPDKPCAWSAECNRGPAFAPSHRPLSLTGEMVYPWMFSQIKALQPFRDAVHELAKRTLRKPYYDPQQLAVNPVPVAAAVYFDDMYVDVELSIETARAVGNLSYWVTNEYEHNGLRQDVRVFRHLREMLVGR